MICISRLAGSLLLAGCLVAACTQRNSMTAVRPTMMSSDMTCALAASEIADRVLAMHPEHLAGSDLQLLSSSFPVPRIILINGSFPLVSMDSLARLFIEMGYPEEKIRDPLSGNLSYSSYLDSAKLAGMVSWYYEKDGVMPLLIGHSQGGMLVIKVLHQLAGSFENSLQVWDPYTDRAELRTTIIDPVSGIERPVVGLKVGLGSAIATGKVMRLLFGQWDMLGRLRQIPDTVAEFSGYHLAHDPVSGTLFGIGRNDMYHPLGSAFVRNIILPEGTGHLGAVRVASLQADKDMNRWINAYRPDHDLRSVSAGKGSGSHLYAADIWHRIKAAWCREVKDWITGRQQHCGVRSHAR